MALSTGFTRPLRGGERFRSLRRYRVAAGASARAGLIEAFDQAGPSQRGDLHAWGESNLDVRRAERTRSAKRPDRESGRASIDASPR